MAFRRRSSRSRSRVRSSNRRSFSGRSRTSRSFGTRRGTRRASSRRGSSNTVRLVIEQPGTVGSLARPGLPVGLMPNPSKPQKSMF